MLGPSYLGALYAQLDERVRNAIQSVGRHDVVTYIDANFLQLFIWERFHMLSPEPNELKVVIPQRIDGGEGSCIPLEVSMETVVRG